VKKGLKRASNSDAKRIESNEPLQRHLYARTCTNHRCTCIRTFAGHDCRRGMLPMPLRCLVSALLLANAAKEAS
jgi:hypothetical protein